MTRTAGNAINNRNFTATEWHLRENVFKIVRIFKENFEEFKNSYATTIAVHVGTRETRCVKGVHIVIAEEYVNAYKYPDSTSRGAHPIDTHVTAGAEQSVILLKKAVYVPYRALIAEDLPNLLVVGRCISVDKTSFVSFRVQASCMEVGQAVGVAIA